MKLEDLKEFIIVEDWIRDLIDVRLAEVRDPEHEPTLEIRNLEQSRQVLFDAIIEGM